MSILKETMLYQQRYKVIDKQMLKIFYKIRCFYYKKDKHKENIINTIRKQIYKTKVNKNPHMNMQTLQISSTLFEDSSIEEERDLNSQIISCQTVQNKPKKQYKSGCEYLQSQLKQQKFGLKSVYQINSFLQDGLILIKGDIMVPFQKDEEFSRLSKYNLFKKINQLHFDPEIGSLEMRFEQIRYGIEDFDHIIRVLSDQPNVDHKNFAEELKHHKKRIEELKRIQSWLKTYKQIDQIRNLVETSFSSFCSKVHQKIKSMYVDGQMSIYKYNIFKVDYEKADYVMTHCCTSEVLLAIIGLDVAQAHQFLMRKGIMEMICHHDFFGVSNYFLQIENKNMTNNCMTDVVLKTFDGIDVYAKIKWLILTNDDPLLQNIFNTEQQHFAIIQQYQINQNMIDFVLSYRRTVQQKFDIRSLENEQDWDYTVKAQTFVDKFYGSQHKK